MFDWVPIQYYTDYFHLAILIFILIALWQCSTGAILQRNVVSINAVWGIVISLVLIFYIGFRPIDAAFGDTMNYASEFSKYFRGKEHFSWQWDTEWLYYNSLFWWGSQKLDLHYFFFINSIVYVGALWLACVRIFKNYYYLPLLIIFAMFTFWSYGVNGVRNGMGASLFLLALTFVNNIPVMVILSIIAIGVHSSVLLMVAAAILAWFIKNSYYYLVGWIACVGLSYAVGGRIQTFLSGLSLMQANERYTGYLTGSNMEGEIVQMSMTFRWDFLLYSAIGVAIGYYFIFRKNYKDEYYHWLYNIYLTTNAFWVLVIRAAYSNRIAQISWFILPLVLVYPFMKKRFWLNHEKVLAIAIVAFYAYGFYTNIIQTHVFSRLF